jgi:hypothetical protein
LTAARSESKLSNAVTSYPVSALIPDFSPRRFGRIIALSSIFPRPDRGPIMSAPLSTLYLCFNTGNCWVHKVHKRVAHSIGTEDPAVQARTTDSDLPRPRHLYTTRKEKGSFREIGSGRHYPLSLFGLPRFAELLKPERHEALCELPIAREDFRQAKSDADGPRDHERGTRNHDNERPRVDDIFSLASGPSSPAGADLDPIYQPSSRGVDGAMGS